MVRFATIGSSKHAHTFLETAMTCEDFHLEAVYSRSMEIAKSMAEKFSAKKAYNSLDAIANDPEIDAVYIASPNAFHARQAIFLMDVGKHILCEKSLASNSREVQEMFEAADRNGVVLLEATRPLHDPGYQLLRQALLKVGKVRHATIRFCQYSSRYDDFLAGLDHNVFDKKCAAGALTDVGVYCVEFLVGLFGAPKKVQASCVKLRTGVDGLGSILAEYDGMTAGLIYSKIAASDLPSDIQGELGNILIYPSPVEPERIEICYNNGIKEVLSREHIEVNTIIYELQDFIKMVNGNMDSEPYREVTIQSMKMMDEVRKQYGIVFPADETDGKK